MNFLAHKKAIFFVIILISGCGGGKSLDTDQDKAIPGPYGFYENEIRVTSKIMTESLLDYFITEWKGPVFLKINRVRNKTGEYIDVSMFGSAIEARLLGEMIKIMISDNIVIWEKEREVMGPQCCYTYEHIIPAGDLKSPNFNLFMDMENSVCNGGNDKNRCYTLTLTLVYIKTGKAVWKKQAEFIRMITRNEYKDFNRDEMKKN